MFLLEYSWIVCLFAEKLFSLRCRCTKKTTTVYEHELLFKTRDFFKKASRTFTIKTQPEKLNRQFIRKHLFSWCLQWFWFYPTWPPNNVENDKIAKRVGVMSVLTALIWNSDIRIATVSDWWTWGHEKPTALFASQKWGDSWKL